MNKRDSGSDAESALEPSVTLREVQTNDINIFFEHQLDPVAVYMAAFTAEDPTDKEAFDKHWSKILADITIVKRTILFEGNVAGHVASFERFGNREVTYWLDKKYWGRGIATRALSRFLGEYKFRPLFARAALDNAGSIRVLEKCGFTPYGRETAFANARGQKIEEVIMILPQ